MSVVIGIAGRAGSGKSTLAAETAALLGAGLASFGDHVRRVVFQGLGPRNEDRRILQEIGGVLVKYPRPFCMKLLQDVFYTPDRPFVVDGVRHVEVYSELIKIASPAACKLVYLDTPEALIQERLKREVGTSTVAEIENDETERQARERILADRADLVLAPGRNESARTLGIRVIEKLELQSLVGEAEPTANGIEEQVNWSRFHALIDTGFTRRLTSNEESELAEYERLALEEDQRSAIGRDLLIGRTETAHTRIAASMNALIDALQDLARRNED